MMTRTLRLSLALVFAGCFSPVDVGSDTKTQAVCTVGQDWTCNADVTQSSLAGQCQADDGPAECVCGSGYVRDATGRCAAFSCGPSTCGACQPGCTARDVCTTSGWQCDCDCPAVCTVGVAMSCNEGVADAGVGVVSGECVQGASGPQCICNPGFTPTSSGRCAPTTTQLCTADQHCNAIAAMSSLAGECVSNGGGGTVCVCHANFQNDASGKCAPSLCLETQGSSCRWMYADGTTPTNGVCGTMSLSPGCACGKTDAGVYQPYCTGACLPNDGGLTRACHAFNCGPIACLDGQTTCASFGACQ